MEDFKMINKKNTFSFLKFVGWLLLLSIITIISGAMAIILFGVIGLKNQAFLIPFSIMFFAGFMFLIDKLEIAFQSWRFSRMTPEKQTVELNKVKEKYYEMKQRSEEAKLRLKAFGCMVKGIK